MLGGDYMSELVAFSSFVALSETLLYVKSQPGLEVSWLGINLASVKFFELLLLLIYFKLTKSVKIL